jgi:hypothetical protein
VAKKSKPGKKKDEREKQAYLAQLRSGTDQIAATINKSAHYQPLPPLPSLPSETSPGYATAFTSGALASQAREPADPAHHHDHFIQQNHEALDAAIERAYEEQAYLERINAVYDLPWQGETRTPLLKYEAPPPSMTGTRQPKLEKRLFYPPGVAPRRQGPIGSRPRVWQSHTAQ